MAHITIDGKRIELENERHYQLYLDGFLSYATDSAKLLWSHKQTMLNTMVILNISYHIERRRVAAWGDVPNEIVYITTGE